MKVFQTALAAGAMLLGSLTAASADTLYSNGPINGTVNAYTISPPYTISDSFLITGPSTATSVDFGAWTFQGVNINTVDWSITSAVNGGITYGGGTANVTQNVLFTNMYNDNVSQDSFSIGAINLSAGTYYLNLDNANTGSSQPAYWDVNSGPSSAFQANGFGTIPSESFDILGTMLTAAPEPSGLIPMVLGFGGIAFLVARKRKSVA